MRAVSDLALLDDVGTARHRLDSSGPLLPPLSCMRTEVGRAGLGWAGLAELPGLAVLQRGHWQPCKHSSQLPCAASNEVILRTGICVAAFQSPAENLEV